MAIQTGSKAPDFRLQNSAGSEISLWDYEGEKVVLLFFPLAFSSVCTDELCTIRDNMKLYNAMNAKVMGISVDSFFALKAFKKAKNLNFTLLSDFNKEVSLKYDVLYDDYFGMKGVSKRASFVIDEKGMVQHTEILEDSDDMPSFKAIQRTLSSIN